MGKQRLSIIPAAALTDSALTFTCLRVLGQIGTYTDDNGWCYPRQIQIAEALDIGREAVNRAVKRLSERGYLEVHKRNRKDGGKAANLYRVILDVPLPPTIDPDTDGVEEAEREGEGPAQNAENDPPHVTSTSHTPCDPQDTWHVTPAVTCHVLAGATSVTTHLNDPLKKDARAWADPDAPPEPSKLRSALKRLAGEVGASAAKAWLNDLVIVSVNPPRLEARSRFVAQQVSQRFGARLKDLLGTEVQIEFAETHGVRQEGQ